MLKLNNQKASSLIFIVIITFVIALYTEHYAVIAMQQQKIINLEAKQFKIGRVKNNLLQSAVNMLTNYSSLLAIPTNIQINMQNNIALIVNIIDNKTYRLFKIDLLLDDPYAVNFERTSKLHIYVAVCEDVSAQGFKTLRVIPLSNIVG
jgi:hypothetical protein